MIEESRANEVTTEPAKHAKLRAIRTRIGLPQAASSIVEAGIVEMASEASLYVDLAEADGVYDAVVDLTSSVLEGAIKRILEKARKA